MECSLSSVFSGAFYHEGMLNFVKGFFFIDGYGLVSSFFNSMYVAYYIYCLMYAKLFQFKDALNLVMLDNFLVYICILVISILLSIFVSVFISEIGL